MHAELLDGLTPEQLSNYPEWVMERYFLSSGQPDRTKTTIVVGMPLELRSQYRASQLREAASKISGLHHATGFGPNTQTIFMGWNAQAVNKEANGHCAKETKQTQAAEELRQNALTERHSNYLKTLNKWKNKECSPSGRYIISCEEIEEQWPDQANDLSLDIYATSRPDVFEASFDFGVLERAMVISADKIHPRII